MNRVINANCHYVPNARPFRFCTSTRRYLEEETARNTISNINEVGIIFMVMKMRLFYFKTFYYVLTSANAVKVLLCFLKDKFYISVVEN